MPSYNPFNPDYQGDPFAEVLIPLAYALPLKFGHYIPELADKLTASKSQVTLHLRPSARWQNGQPFTSKDVLTSLLLAGAQDNTVWGYFSSITTPNPHTVVIKVVPGVAPSLVLYDVVQIGIVNNSQYEHLVPKGLEGDLLKYWATYRPLHPTTGTVAAATASPEAKTMSDVAAALPKFNPHTMIGDGPFTVLRANPSEILLKKWPGFWDANVIHEPYVEVDGMTDTVSVPAFLSGRLDFTQGATYTDATYSKLNSTPGLKLFGDTDDVEQLGLLFNYKHYPFNLTPVRQAIAYLIPRKKLTELDVGGTFSQRPPVPVPVGIPISLARHELTKAQLNSLNPYPYDPAKAAKLLRSAGFEKKKGAWYTPKGARFTAQVTVDSALALFENDGNVIANDLKKFGIATTNNAVSSTSIGADITDGTFEMAYWFISSAVSNPLVDLQDTFSSYNYPPTWNGKGKCPCSSVTIGMPPIEKVPGLGRVVISQAITSEAETVAAPAKWRALTWDWVRLLNKQLPVLPLENNAIDITHSNVRYDDWPPRNNAVYYLAGGGGPRIMIFNQYGFLRLKKS